MNPGRGPSILVVDDDPDLLRLSVWLLKSIYPTAEVRTARDRSGAAAELKSVHPDLLVSDLYLPDPEAVELFRQARADAGTADIKILAMTGQHTPETRKQALDCGADAYLTKPFDPQDLRRAVTELLGELP